MHTCTVSYEFLLKPRGISRMSPDPQVGSGHKTNHTLALSSLTCREGGKSLTSAKGLGLIRVLQSHSVPLEKAEAL